MKLKFKEKIHNSFLFIKNIFAFNTGKIKNNKISKKMLFMISGVVFCYTITVASTMIASEFFPNNREITLSNIASEYNYEVGEKPMCIIYPYQTIYQNDKTVAHMTEWSKEVRNITTDVCFDLYLADWNESVSPAIIEENNITSDISLIMWPVSNYNLNNWLYDMPLLTKLIKDTPSPNDIYIDAEYANNIILNSNGSYNSYNDLLNVSINIPYKAYSKTYSNFYKIKGVIDNSSDVYQKYNNMFGRFFITSEYLSLPILNITYYELPFIYPENIGIFSSILKVYDYKSYLQSYQNDSKAYAFQYRITFCGNIDGDFSSKNIIKKPSKFTQKTNALFEAFATPQYILNITTYLMLGLSCFLMGIYLTLKLKKEIDRNILVTIIYTLCIIIGLFLGVGFSQLLNKITALSVLTCTNYLGFLLTCIYAVIILIIFSKKKKIKSTK